MMLFKDVATLVEQSVFIPQEAGQKLVFHSKRDTLDTVLELSKQVPGWGFWFDDHPGGYVICCSPVEREYQEPARSGPVFSVSW